MGLTELLLVVAVGGGITAVLFLTFRGAAGDAGATEGAAEAPPKDDAASRRRAELQERQAALIRSLEEIESDREAGNLSAADYETMRRRYEREAAEVLRELGQTEPVAPAAASTSSATSDRSRTYTTIGWAGAAVGFVALALLVMMTSLRPRGEGDTITGNLPGEGGMAEADRGGGALVPVDRERLEELEAAVAADSSNVENLVELGHLYLSTQRFGEATQVSMKALSIDEDQPGALAHLGMILVAAGHTQEAVTALERALEIDPDFPEALLYRGIVAFQNQDFQRAVETWERYLEVAPPEANVARVRGMLEGARQAAGSQGGA